MNLESQIINQLFHNDRYARAILPYLSSNYFKEDGNKKVFELVNDFVNKYQNVPTPVAIRVEVEQADLPEHIYEAVKEALDTNTKDKPVEYDWMVDQTEKYCKDRAIENAIREGITILGDPKRARGEIEGLIREALSISFDGDLGLDILEDAERQYDKTHGDDARIPFMIDILNKATDGGVTTKTLNVILAGCVRPDTSVMIRYAFDGIPRTIKAPISKIKQLLEEKIQVQIHSPDGFVPVTGYVDKGIYTQYALRLEDQRIVYCNADHLFKTNVFGWCTAREIAQLTPGITQINIVTDQGLMKGSCIETDFVCQIVDLVIDHPEHRYYANGIESHNTNVGKSLILCHLAADYLLQGKNVMYFSHEMSEEIVASRIYANLLNLDLDKHKIMPKKWFLEQVAKVKAKTPGKLMVKEFPSGGAHTGHYRHHIQELKLKKGFIVDVVIGDYLGIMASSRYKPGQVQLRTYLHSIAQEFRALNQELDTVGWTAFQTNREGFGSSDPSLTNIAEAWGVTHEADWVGVISQSEEMEALGQFLCKQDKSRYSNKDKMRRFVIGVDKMKQKLHDVDESAQKLNTETYNDEDDDNSDAFGKFGF